MRVLFLLTLSLLTWNPVRAASQNQGPDPETQLEERVEAIETHWKKGQYEEAKRLAQQLLEDTKGIESSQYTLEALYQLALIHYLQDEYKAANDYLEISLSTVRLEGDKRREADLLNLQGNLFWKEGQLALAVDSLRKALELFSELNNKLSMASASNNLGNVHASAEEHEQAISYFKQGLAWVAELPKTESLRMRASLLSNTGESLVALHRLDEAEPFLLDSLNAELLLNEPRDLAFSYSSLGDLYAGLESFSKAIEYHQQALRIQLELQDHWAATYSRLRLSEAHLKNNKPAKAITVLKDGFDDARRLKSDGMLQQYTGQFQKAYLALGEDGLADYYKELSAWFEERHIAQSQVDSLETAIGDQLSAPSGPPSSRWMMARWGSIGLLLLVIILLIIENRRLRGFRSSAPKAE